MVRQRVRLTLHVTGSFLKYFALAYIFPLCAAIYYGEANWHIYLYALLLTLGIGLILEFGFNRLKASSIEAKYATWNKASGRVMEKNGMKNVEYLEKGFEKNGTWVEEYRMEITRSVWDQLKV